MDVQVSVECIECRVRFASSRSRCVLAEGRVRRVFGGTTVVQLSPFRSDAGVGGKRHARRIWAYGGVNAHAPVVCSGPV